VAARLPLRHRVTSLLLTVSPAARRGFGRVVRAATRLRSSVDQTGHHGARRVPAGYDDCTNNPVGVSLALIRL
jgi:hypothetical protein